MISPRLCLVFMALSRSLEKYSATGAVENTFTSILLLCVQKHTLYSTIAKWPAHCLNLGIALKVVLCTMKLSSILSATVRIPRKERRSLASLATSKPLPSAGSHELYSLRRDVEEILMPMTIPGSNPADYPWQQSGRLSLAVCEPARSTHGLQHSQHLPRLGHVAYRSSAEPNPSRATSLLPLRSRRWLHSLGYRIIAVGDYLDVDKVYDHFNSQYKSSEKERQEEELEISRHTLETLKDEAHAHVEMFSESALHHADKSGLRYLT